VCQHSPAECMRRSAPETGVARPIISRVLV
jgi:hypothetical protein